MNYIGTLNTDLQTTSCGAIVQGLCADGGLFVPDRIPSLRPSYDAPYDYLSLAYDVISPYLATDLAPDELRHCLSVAYGNTFRQAAVTPVHTLSADTQILELFHGPSAAFKDVALQLLPQLMTASARQYGVDRDILILVATSGDTGKAALCGFADRPGTHICVFYPQDGVSTVQRLQMETQAGDNVHVAAVAGNFDDCQRAVKQVFAARGESDKVMLSSANSINWGRLVPQITYYYAAYRQLVDSGRIGRDEAVNVVVPTGNFGNILAAYYAKRMGLPIAKLICASNSNNVLTEFIDTGCYNANRAFYNTASPSMDILVSSNLERFLFHISGNDPEIVKHCMAALSTDRQYRITDDMCARMREMIWGGYASEDDTARAIRETHQAYGYCSDPHTAVGIHALKQYRTQTGDNRTAIVASTASPFKFCSSVLSALGLPVSEDERHNMDTLAGVAGRAPSVLSDVWDQPRRFDTRLHYDDVPAYVGRIVSDIK